MRQFKEFISRNKIDLIHTHMSSAHFFGAIVKYVANVPCIATAHHCRFQPHWRFNDFVIANSDATRNFHIRRNLVSRNRIKTVYCYTDLEKYLTAPERSDIAIRRQQRVADNTTMIGVVGDICGRKGQIYLVKALPKLIRRYPDLVVLFVGSYMPRREKYMRGIRQFLLRNKLHRRVRWLGRRDDIPKLIKSLDVCVVPSVEEPLGLVAIEALACGTPVVASNTGGLPEVVHHNETGLLVPRKDPQAIVDAVSKCLDDQPLARSLSSNGVEFVKQTFCPDRLTSLVENIYHDIVDAKQPIHQKRAA